MILFADGCTDRLQFEGKYDVQTAAFYDWYAAGSRHLDNESVLRVNAHTTATERLGAQFTARSTIAAGVAFNPTNRPENPRQALLQVRSATGIIAMVRWDQTSVGTIQLQKGDGTVLASISGIDGINGGWNQVSVKITVDTVTPANGSFALYLKDTFVGAGTYDLGDAAITEVAISGQSTSTSTRLTAFQDFWVTDGDLLYDARMATLRPNAVGASSQWTPSAVADNYTMVNDVTLDRAKYVATDTNAYVDLYQMSDLPVDNARDTIYGVFATAVASKTVLDPRSIELATYVGTTQYFGDEEAIDGEAVFRHFWSLNPGTSLAWTKSDVDAAHFGVRAVIV